YVGIYDPSFYNNAGQEALKVLDEDPKNFDALMTIGTAYQRLGRIEDAMRYIQLGRDLYPKTGEPFSRLASLTLATPKPAPDMVLQLMETAVELDPNDAGYVCNLGGTYDRVAQRTRERAVYQ